MTDLAPNLHLVRLCGEFWTMEEIRKVHAWLYGNEFCDINPQTWREIPRHVKWLLQLNKKSYWMKLIQDMPSALRGNYVKPKEESKEADDE